MQHSSAADAPVSPTVGHGSRRLQAEEQQSRRRRPDYRSWCDAITPRKPLRLVAVRVPPRTRTSMPDRVRVGPHGVFRRLGGNGPLLRILAGGARRPMLRRSANHERSVLTQPLAHASARRIATTCPAHALACPTRLSKHLGRWLASRAEAPQQAIRAVAVTVPIACRRRRGKEVGPHLWSLVFSRGSDRRRDPSLARSRDVVVVLRRPCFPRGACVPRSLLLVESTVSRSLVKSAGMECPRFRGHLRALVERPGQEVSTASNQTAVSGGVSS